MVNVVCILFLLIPFENIYFRQEICPYLNCSKTSSICNSSIECLSDSNPLCASNLEQYSNECQMNKYACQLNIRLTKLHDGPCDNHEQQQKIEGIALLFGYDSRSFSLTIDLLHDCIKMDFSKLICINR